MVPAYKVAASTIAMALIEVKKMRESGKTMSLREESEHIAKALQKRPDKLKKLLKEAE